MPRPTPRLTHGLIILGERFCLNRKNSKPNCFSRIRPSIAQQLQAVDLLVQLFGRVISCPKCGKAGRISVNRTNHYAVYRCRVGLTPTHPKLCSLGVFDGRFLLNDPEGSEAVQRLWQLFRNVVRPLALSVAERSLLVKIRTYSNKKEGDN